MYRTGYIRKYCKYGGHRILVQFWMKRMNFLELGEVVVVEEWQLQETIKKRKEAGLKR